MSKINVSLVGRVTKDPETKSVGTSGKSITKISLVADSCTKKDGGGFEPIWLTVALWSKDDGTVPGVVNYIAKGSQLFITGELDIRAWEANGKHGVEHKIESAKISLVGPKVEKEAPSDDGEVDPFANDQE